MAQIPALLWLWCRPAAVAPTGPIAWEPARAMGAALKKDKKTKKKKKIKKNKVETDGEIFWLDNR